MIEWVKWVVFSGPTDGLFLVVGVFLSIMKILEVEPATSYQWGILVLLTFAPSILTILAVVIVLMFYFATGQHERKE